MDPFWAALALTVLAGASTAVGGALGAIGRPISGRGLAMALGLAAGVMVTHEARHAAWAGRVVFLRDGVIVDETGADEPEVLLAEDATR